MHGVASGVSDGTLAAVRADLVSDWLCSAAVRAGNQLTLWASYQVSQQAQEAEQQNDNQPRACAGPSVLCIFYYPDHYGNVNCQNYSAAKQIDETTCCSSAVVTTTLSIDYGQWKHEKRRD
jgi:hypothetical protein